MTKRLKGPGVLLVLALVASGCAAGQAFRQGESAMRAGNLDEAVAAYRKASQAAPDNPNYKIALQRAQQAAARSHLDKAREFEQQDQLEAALGEYRTSSEYDPTNRVATAKVAELDRTIRDRIEASRPKPPIQQLRERARAASAEPILNPASREPLIFRFTNASLRDILGAIGSATGINISYDRDVADRATTVALDGITLEQALNQIMTMNQLSYKVMSERSIFVFPDTAPKHAQYDEQVVRTFYLSHADATEVSQILSTIIRLPGIAVQPAIVANKTANTLTVRGTSSVVQILEKIIEQNDKPRAEIVLDVEILEVDRSRTKNYGLNLSEYALGGIFSPEVSPSATTTRDDDRRRGRHHDRNGHDDDQQRHVDRAERREVAAALQPEHDLARHQHGGLLPRGADGDREVPRIGHAHQDRREAAAAGRRGHQDDAEARRADSRSSPPATRRLRPAARA